MSKAAFASGLKGLKVSSRPKTLSKLTTKPIWTIDDGITFSLFSRWIICRHRFWIRAVLGLRQDEGFVHRLEYGNMLHAGIEEVAAQHKVTDFGRRLTLAQKGIVRLCDTLRYDHPDAFETIDWWQNVAVYQFERYVRHWQQVDKARTPVYQEQAFDHVITLPSQRRIRIRGKYDGVFLKKVGRKTKHVLLETKSKGDIDEVGLLSSLNCDLQSMFYLFALEQEGIHCRDILYNVILRPLGGKYPMRQKKSETKITFLQRIKGDIYSHPEKYFKRFDVSVTEEDMTNFKYRMLFPLLEQFLDWWNSISANPLNPWRTPTYTGPYGDKPNPHHFQRPFGVFDSLALGNRGDYFDFLISDGVDKKGLKQAHTAFPELDDPSLSNRKGSDVKASTKDHKGTASKADTVLRKKVGRVGKSVPLRKASRTKNASNARRQR